MNTIEYRNTTVRAVRQSTVLSNYGNVVDTELYSAT